MELPERYFLIVFLALPLVIMTIVMWRRRATIKMPKKPKMFISGVLWLLVGLGDLFIVDMRLGMHGLLLTGSLFVVGGAWMMKEAE